jgi:hypothetical protein
MQQCVKDKKDMEKDVSGAEAFESLVSVLFVCFLVWKIFAVLDHIESIDKNLAVLVERSESAPLAQPRTGGSQ